MSVALNKTYVAVTASVGLVSACTCIGFLSYFTAASCIWWLRKRWRHDDGRLLVKPSSLTFLHTQFGLLFTSLILADSLQAIAFSIGFHWLANGMPPTAAQYNTCATQGILIGTGNVASALSSITIAVHTFHLVLLKRKPKWGSVISAVVVLWLAVFLMSLLGPLLIGRRHPAGSSTQYYAFTSIWCFISTEHQSARLWLHYLWLLLALFINLVVYVYIFIYLWLYSRRASKAINRTYSHDALKKVASRLLLYPVAYGIVVLPIATMRLCQMAGSTVSREALCIGGSILACAGWINVLLYGLTRKIVVMDFKARRPSWTRRKSAPSVKQVGPEMTQNNLKGKLLDTSKTYNSASVHVLFSTFKDESDEEILKSKLQEESIQFGRTSTFSSTDVTPIGDNVQEIIKDDAV